MNKVELYDRLFRWMDLNENESKILIGIIKNGNKAKMNQLLEDTKISRATIYQYLKKFQHNNIIKKFGKRPIYYSITESFNKKIKDEISKLSETFSSGIAEFRIEETQEVIKLINRIFQNEGYVERIIDHSNLRKIKKKIRYPPEILQILDSNSIKKFEKLISIGVIFIDSHILKDLTDFLPDLGYLPIFINELNQIFKCAFIFFLINNDVKNPENVLEEIQKSHYRNISKNFRYEIIGSNLEEFLRAELKDIDEGIRVTKDLLKLLEEKINKIENLIILSHGYCNYINNFVTEASIGPKFNLPGFIITELTNIIEPVEKITSRELRNLEIYNIRYREVFLKIKNYMVDFENRLKVPLIDQIHKDLNYLDFLIEKFEPIEFELNDLENIIFKYGLNLIKADNSEERKKISINPFFMTEPFELDGFYVNQGKIRENFRIFFNNIKNNTQDYIRFLKGDPGTGKTHILKYTCFELEKLLNIKTIYIDCNVGYDIIPMLFKEITREILYPKELREFIKRFRNRNVSTIRDLFKLLKELTKLLTNFGYDGFILIIDEFENVIHYKYLEAPKELNDLEIPLVITQFKELIGFEKIDLFGLIISARTRVYEILDFYLGLKDFNKYILEPDKLELNHFKQLIEHRYKTWNAKKLIFENDVIIELTKITNNNIRNILRYLRELYKISQDKTKIEKINLKHLKQIDYIPIFKY